MKKTKIYISGKISGLAEEEYSKNFTYAMFSIYGKTKDLRPIEFVNPLKIKPLFGIRRWFFFMVNDLREQRKCTHSAFQKNWIDSRGACIEYYFAKFIFKHEIIFL